MHLSLQRITQGMAGSEAANTVLNTGLGAAFVLSSSVLSKGFAL